MAYLVEPKRMKGDIEAFILRAFWRWVAWWNASFGYGDKGPPE